MAEEASRLGRSKTKGIQASSFLLLEELVANFNNQIIIMLAQNILIIETQFIQCLIFLNHI
jgi:hypothetical protein